MLGSGMAQMRISVAASLLGVSDDTLRRWVEAGRLSSSLDEQGRRVVDGAALAALAQELADGALDGLAAVRAAIGCSVELERYEPQNTAAWDALEK